ncbi:unnamed protein product, partial [Sphacelaria rigidula]
ASPCLGHWRGLQHALRYLSGTLDVCLRCCMGIPTTENTPVGFAHSDLATDADTRRSVTGCFLLMKKSWIVCRSNPCASVALSSIEVLWTANGRHGTGHVFLLRFYS